MTESLNVLNHRQHCDRRRTEFPNTKAFKKKGKSKQKPEPGPYIHLELNPRRTINNPGGKKRKKKLKIQEKKKMKATDGGGGGGGSEYPQKSNTKKKKRYRKDFYRLGTTGCYKPQCLTERKTEIRKDTLID